MRGIRGVKGIERIEEKYVQEECDVPQQPGHTNDGLHPPPSDGCIVLYHPVASVGVVFLATSGGPLPSIGGLGSLGRE